MFSVLLSGAGAPGGAVVGTGGAALAGGAADLAESTDALLLSLAVGTAPLASWWFSWESGSVAERLESDSLSAEGASGGAGGAELGGPVLTPPLTESDLKNSSRLLCNCNEENTTLLI